MGAFNNTYQVEFICSFEVFYMCTGKGKRKVNWAQIFWWMEWSIMNTEWHVTMALKFSIDKGKERINQA
jgi:hypothetical protein